MKNFSRVFAVATVAFVGTASAVCPLFDNRVVNTLHSHKTLIGASITADHFCDKHEHAKKAFLCSAAQLTTKSNAHDLAERFVVDYAIRKGSDAIGLEKHVAAIIKKCDVLPEGAIRDNVNPVVKGAVDVALHPEALTELAMGYVLPKILKALGK
jgi:hypothetical protein